MRKDFHLLCIYTAPDTVRPPDSSFLLFPCLSVQWEWRECLSLLSFLFYWLTLDWQGCFWFQSSVNLNKAAQPSESSRNICHYLLLFLDLNRKWLSCYGKQQQNKIIFCSNQFSYYLLLKRYIYILVLVKAKWRQKRFFCHIGHNSIFCWSIFQ